MSSALHRRTRRILLFCAVQLLAAAAIVAAFLWRDFLDAHRGETTLSACLMHDILHLYCPGCGGTRAMVALFRGQIVHSLLCNPLSAYIAVGFVLTDIRAAVAILRNEPRVLHLHAAYFYVMLAIALIFCLVRNLLMLCFGVDYLGDLVQFWH